jgi:hypothetical protein
MRVEEDRPPLDSRDRSVENLREEIALLSMSLRDDLADVILRRDQTGQTDYSTYMCFPRDVLAS